MKKLFLIVIFFSFGCGIKGPPKPPDQNPYIGRGKPTYKRAVENFKMPEGSGKQGTDSDEEDSE